MNTDYSLNICSAGSFKGPLRALSGLFFLRWASETAQMPTWHLEKAVCQKKALHWGRKAGLTDVSVKLGVYAGLPPLRLPLKSNKSRVVTYRLEQLGLLAALLFWLRQKSFCRDHALRRLQTDSSSTRGMICTFCNMTDGHSLCLRF